LVLLRINGYRLNNNERSVKIIAAFFGIAPILFGYFTKPLSIDPQSYKLARTYFYTYSMIIHVFRKEEIPHERM